MSALSTFRDDISNCSGVIVLTDRLKDTQTLLRTLPPSLRKACNEKHRYITGHQVNGLLTGASVLTPDADKLTMLMINGMLRRKLTTDVYCEVGLKPRSHRVRRRPSTRVDGRTRTPRPSCTCICKCTLTSFMTFHDGYR